MIIKKGLELSHLKKAIINLDIMSREVYNKLMTFKHLQFKPSDHIWEYYPKTGKGNYNSKTMFNEAPILETLLMLDYLKKKDIKPEFWYNTSLFIYNEDLYSIREKDIVKIDLKDTVFASMREAWSHPFFGILKQILDKNNGKLAKPNIKTMNNTGCMNKFYALNELYSKRDEYIGDFILPYNIKPNEISLFKEFININLGDKIVLKYDCIQEGKGVVFKDISRQNSVDELTDILKYNKIKGKEVLITPAYDIETEYRCYFTKNGRHKNIYSIKQRINYNDIDVYSKKNIQIYKNISVKWHEVESNSDIFNYGEKIAKKILKYLSYDTGCLEFARTKCGRIVFFEVNQMAGPLPFEGEDTVNMNNYYLSIFDNMFCTDS